MKREQIRRLEKENPRNLFLVDAMGALLSAFLLGVVLTQLEWFFGIPKSSLYILALIPCFFAVYDFICYRNSNTNLKVSLKSIAVMNLLYCCLSIGIAIYHIKVITYFGWIYVLLEILIIIVLANFELRVAKKV